MVEREIEVLAADDAVARRGAGLIAEHARAAVAERGAFAFAVSGGRTPWVMFAALADQDVPWRGIAIYQVDERIAEDGHPDRNLTHLRESLPEQALDRLVPMPVTEPDVEAAAAAYADGLPERLDLVHLGLGDDGHTASLVPGDPVLAVTDRDVALTGEYQGRRRMTLTYPMLDRAGEILWVVTGAEKAVPLAKLLARDESVPAGRVRAARAVVLADEAAMGKTA